MSAEEAEDKHAALVHSKKHIELVKGISSKKFDSRRNSIAMKFNSIYFNKGSTEAAYLAAGSVIEVAERVAEGDLDSAFAVVRPPGHHAEVDQPMGFCLFNNVAIATNFILNERADLGIKKILIVDWDVHHGNGTQKMFYKDPRVLFFSVHRHEYGSFYPAGDDGSYIMVGEGPGAGYNINVPWQNGRCGDADYLAVWEHVLIPVAKEFNPDLIFVSAGFDAAINDPLGGCRVTPDGYAVMLKQLMEFANGKIVMALEGGYNLDSLANSALSCVQVLLNEGPVIICSEAYPFESSWRVIQTVREIFSAFWPSLAEKLPENLTRRKTPQIQILSSDSEDEHESALQVVSEDLEKVLQPLSSLTLKDDVHKIMVPPSWRDELSRIDIWYAAYGSNMSKDRFLCYVQGGQAEGMRIPYAGSADKSPPKDILWMTFPHRLFFGRDFSATWGPGGVAFLHPESNIQEKSYLCLYRITLEQFNDVCLQENAMDIDTSSPLFDLTSLQSIESKKQVSVETGIKRWYDNVVYLGKEKDVPILTMTCSLSDVDGYKSGKLPIYAPCKGYADTLVRGLVQGGKLSEEEAVSYIQEATIKPL
ncbi:histone modifying enzyme [Lithospermum erythrorhizon]|uniref:histone deacetylase n=1 Tax=Lithospermum erythrorhizon TaxID=34254 RepID=A0AAV3PHK6_LITER